MAEILNIMDAVAMYIVLGGVFMVWAAAAALVMFANFMRAPSSMKSFPSLFYQTRPLEKMLLVPGLIWLAPLLLLVLTIRKLSASSFK